MAGGAGMTPFIAILRELKKDNAIDGNQLFFSNKTVDDIILHDELDYILGENAHYIVTESNTEGDHIMKGYMDKAFINKHIKDFNKPFYICGPDKMISDLKTILEEAGAKTESVVFEK